ncbi:MAG: hypothetical protein JXQ93_13465 [Flavobacteriaceae bacterium]
MKKNNNIIFLLIAIFISISCYSQNVKNIKNEVAKFLYENNEIDSLQYVDEKIYVTELLENTILGYNKKGIYRVGTFSSPSETYILLKNDEKVEIIELKNFSQALKKISFFLTKNKFDNIQIVSYMEKITQIYRRNKYHQKVKY